MQKLLLIIVLLFVSGQIGAQSIESKLDQMDVFRQYNLQEKIYVHTDRANYTAGETIWFKMYNTIGIDNGLSLLSNVDYIQLIDPRNNIVDDQIIAVNLGVGNGSMTLADTLVEGTYRLRAYTNWMRNYDKDFYFEKTIGITNGRVDNILTSSSRSEEGNNSFYDISLRTIQGNPIGKTNVRYEIFDGEKVVGKGSERTDESGLLRIKADGKTRGRDLRLSFANLDKRNVSKVIHTKALEADNSLQILPEAGHTLSGHLNTFGLKALKPDGKGIKAHVDIVDAEGQVISSAETNELGIGAMSLFVNVADGYRANVRFADGTQKTFDLPEITTSGMSLVVNNQNESKVYAQVNISEDLLSEKDLFFVIHHWGQPFYASKQKMNKVAVVFSADKKSLPMGVLTITILNADFKPLFERPIFVHQQGKLLDIDANINQASFGTRDHVLVEIQSGSPSDSTRIASLSASVVNLSKLTDTLDQQANLLSSLFYESDIKGYIENPGYYFTHNNEIKIRDLDHLLLTQGWRRINWDELGFVDSAKQFQPEKSLSISGYTRKIGRKAPSPKANVQLISTEDFASFVDTVSGEDGFFIFDGLSFPDSSKFMISAKDQKGKNNIDIVVEKQDTPPIHALERFENDLNNAYIKELKEAKQFFSELERKGLMPNVIEIEEVVVSRERKKAPEHSRNLNGPGNADQIITHEDLETCPTLEMCLNGRLLGVIFQGGIPYNTRGMVPMQVILDGMYVEADMLSTINVMDVASVEVLRNVNYTSIYGSYGGNGVIVITTKIGTEARSNYTPRGLLVIQPKGLSVPREFYKPVYTSDSEQIFANDLRTTIHWEPMIVTNDEGKASFDFYTSDEPGIYRMVLEGIDINGKIGRKVFDFEVKK